MPAMLVNPGQVTHRKSRQRTGSLPLLNGWTEMSMTDDGVAEKTCCDIDIATALILA